MKIICSNECYIQKSDVDYLVNNNRIIPNELFREIQNNNDDFIRIDDLNLMEYIIESDIPSFNEMYSKSTSYLEKKAFRIKLLLFDNYDGEKMSEEELEQARLEEQNLKYLLEQIKEIIKLKKGTTTLVYPDIPKPNTLSVTNGNIYASHSLNFGNIVIYNLDGSRLDIEQNKEFCDIAYKMLMHDYMKEDNVDLDYIYNNNYLVLKKKIKKLIKKAY